MKTNQNEEQMQNEKRNSTVEQRSVALKRKEMKYEITYKIKGNDETRKHIQESRLGGELEAVRGFKRSLGHLNRRCTVVSIELVEESTTE